jgi:hypothetical protein
VLKAAHISIDFYTTHIRSLCHVFDSACSNVARQAAARDYQKALQYAADILHQAASQQQATQPTDTQSSSTPSGSTSSREGPSSSHKPTLNDASLHTTHTSGTQPQDLGPLPADSFHHPVAAAPTFAASGLQTGSIPRQQEAPKLDPQSQHQGPSNPATSTNFESSTAIQGTLPTAAASIQTLHPSLAAEGDPVRSLPSVHDNVMVDAIERTEAAEEAARDAKDMPTVSVSLSLQHETAASSSQATAVDSTPKLVAEQTTQDRSSSGASTSTSVSSTAAMPEMPRRKLRERR